MPALQQMARSSEPPSRPTAASASPAEANGGGGLLARFHALWTLEGLGALDAPLVREGMKDKNPRMRVQAIRASETLYKAGDKSLADDYRALTKDADQDVVIQAMLTVNLFKLPDAAELIKAAQAASKARGVALIGERLLAPAPTFGGGRRGPITPDEEKRLQQGNDVFGAVCFACHGTDGMGKALDGAAPGTMMAPPLVGSPRLQGHRDLVIKVLLQGMTGPIDGKKYPDVMAPLGGGSTDEWVAGVASFVRTSFGNSGGMVTPGDVARVRKETAGRKTPWTLPELEASLPRALDAGQWKLTASHGAETAAGAATLRGWSSGVPQAPDMSFTVELAQPVAVTELQFESSMASGRGGRGGRGAPASPPIIGYPRAYSVQVSADGSSWSTPVATGKGEGVRTTVTFAPTRAKFVRITQTDTVTDAPAWSIRNLRIYEAPASKGGSK